ncbi:TonB-dependent siderophore receptor [Halioxenophilus sp. WMMB6]|uniref:TonB-dependent siderophore receptor n=1 Tax=Halioxenophilus sp. WMMB6 TaxID=3073815 RepID=UPI00295E4E95|nr:TonB-dependent receptor plug domain-containing protein [Halioxenophilus sp. WMMB6]
MTLLPKKTLPALISAALLPVVASPMLAVAQEIETVNVTVVKDENSIMPSGDGTSSFGFDKPLVETPRSISEVSADLVEAYGLRSVDDLVRLTPGAFTSSFFGIAGAMDIRGESADNYYRGFRRIANPGAIKTNIRGAQNLEIMRGPVTPLYGTGSVGGQLNYIPKSAKTDTTKYIREATGKLNATIGTYDQKIIAAEGGLPVTIAGKQGGVYAFAEYENSGSFYDGFDHEDFLTQLTFDLDLSDSLVLEAGMQWQKSDAVQVSGWNRVTQDLIDNGTYITGAAPVRNSDNSLGADRLLPQESGFVTAAAPYFINSSFSGVGTFCSPATVTDGVSNSNYSYNGNDIFCPGVPNGIENRYALTNPGTAQIDHETIFIDPLDFADTTAVTAYLDLTKHFDSGASWKNQLFYDYMDHTKYQSWGFTADYPGAEVAEFRSTFKFDSNSDSLQMQHIAGLSVRYENLSLNHAFYDETFDFRDITVGATPNDRIDSAVANPYANATILYDANGNPTGISGTVRRNFNEEQDSKLMDTGLFYLADIKYAGFNLLAGARYDYYDVDAENNAKSLLGIPFGGDESGTDDAISWNLSLSYPFASGVVPYLTLAEATSLSTNQLGGIIVGTIKNGQFLQDSELSEFGIKYSSEDQRIYAALAYFDQEKTYRDGQTGALIAVYSDGVEFEARALITDNFSLTATATHIETTEVSDGALAVINGAEFAAQNGLEAWQVYGGRIAGNRSTFIGSNVELDRGGLPDNTVSLYGNFTYPMGSGKLTSSVGFSWADETYTDAFETVLLPDYMVWTASVGFVTDSYELLLSVNNLFDEEYYTSADLFDSVVVKPSEGRTASLTASYKF